MQENDVNIVTPSNKFTKYYTDFLAWNLVSPMVSVYF